MSNRLGLWIQPTILICLTTLIPLGDVAPAKMQIAESDVGNDLTHHVVRMKLPDSFSQPELSSLAFSADGSLVAVALKNGKISLIRVGTGDVVSRIPIYAGEVIDMSFSRDGSRLLLLGTGGRKLIDIALGIEIKFKLNRIKGEIGLSTVLRNGKWIVSDQSPGKPVALCGVVQDGDEVTGIGEGKSGEIESVKGESERQLAKLLSGPSETFLRLEYVPHGKRDPETVLLQRRPIEGLIADRFRKNSKKLFNENMAWVHSGPYHTFCNAATGQEVRALCSEYVRNSIGTGALSFDSKKYAWLGRKPDKEGFAIEVYDIAHRKRIQTIDKVRSHTPSGTMLRTSAFYGLAFSPSGKQILVGAWDRINVYGVESGEFIKEFSLQDGLASSQRLKFAGTSRGATLLDQAIAEEGNGADLDPTSGPRKVENFALSSQGLLAVGCWPGDAKLWDFDNGHHIFTFKNLPKEDIETVAFSQDGKWLVFFVDGDLHIVDVDQIKGAKSG